jgi:isopenicillin-N epimerase
MTSTAATPPAPLLPNLRDQFMLAPSLKLLNHGSFGAVPRVVFDEHTLWRTRIENDPVEILARQSPKLIDAAKSAAGNSLGMNPADFGLVTNATEGINCVLRSRQFNSGDELLTTNHVYNAVRQAMKYVAQRAGAAYREIDILTPLQSPGAILRPILSSLTPRTRLLVIDHITSPTAIVFPVAEIIAACAERNIDVLIDGAHAPGILDLNVARLAPAYYSGNLHKWAFAPKGCAFIWVRPDRQTDFHPTIISHNLGKGLPAEFVWQGTRDFAAWFTIPRAFQFMTDLGFEKILTHNHQMAVWANQMLCARWKTSALTPIDGSMLGSMATVPLPRPLDNLSDEQLGTLGSRLHAQFDIEVPFFRWQDASHVRPCCQIYNSPEDFFRLADTIQKINPGDL